MGARRQRFPDCARSPAAAFSDERPEGNGCIERFFRTLKEQLLWARRFETTEELTEALLEFRQRYNSQ
jgi:transposase InsO family protein